MQSRTRHCPSMSTLPASVNGVGAMGNTPAKGLAFAGVTRPIPLFLGAIVYPKAPLGLRHARRGRTGTFATDVSLNVLAGTNFTGCPNRPGENDGKVRQKSAVEGQEG